MDVFFDFGVWTKDFILWIANFLVSHDAAPGIVAIILFLIALVFLICSWINYSRRFSAIKKLFTRLNDATEPLAQDRDAILYWFKEQKKNKGNGALSEAWDVFDKTLYIDDSKDKDEPVLRGSIRPSAFFNTEDLRFGAGFIKVLPGLLISIGLALTFLGLIAALADMSKGEINAVTMSNLIGIASAKFIMSLTGLFCSIILTIFLKLTSNKLEKRLHDLCSFLENKIQFVSLEQIGLEQLQTMIEDREHHRSLTLQMISEIGGPLKNELPNSISSSIATAMEPLLELTSKQGTENISAMASDLSQQLSASVGTALETASERLTIAGDRIGQLADRLDNSSGNMGKEMEGAISRVAQAVDELRNSMSQTASETSGVFNQGAENLLAAMNTTLESIRDNTSEGAKAISSAAADMRDSAQAMRKEMEVAAQQGADAARTHIQSAGGQAEGAISEASHSLLKAFEKTSTDIVTMTQSLSSKTSTSLIEPINTIVSKIEEITNTLKGGATEMVRMVDSVRDGAKAGSDAAISFRSASQDLVEAVAPVRDISERMEGAIKQLATGTKNAVDIVTESSRTTAQASSQTLLTAQETLAHERQGIEASLAAVTIMLERIKGQGERMDTIDEKLGTAFDLYTDQTEMAMQSMRNHVLEMSDGLNKALDTLQTILDALQEFQPEQRFS